MSKRDLKFEAGDIVTIIKDTTLHGFPIGSHVLIDRLHDWDNGYFSYVGTDVDGDGMLFDDDDCEAFNGELV